MSSGFEPPYLKEHDRRRQDDVTSNGYLVIAGTAMIYFVLGSLNTWGNINPYVISAMRNYNVQVTFRESGRIYSAMVSGESVGMLLSGFIEKKLKLNLTVLLGGIILSFSVFVSAFFLTNKALFTLTYGLLFGVGMGISLVPPYKNAMLWFPHYKGFITGIIQSGFGLSALVLNPIHTSVINPQNLFPIFHSETKEAYFEDAELLSRVPKLIILLSFIYCSLILVGVFVMRRPKKQNEALLRDLENSLVQKRPWTISEAVNTSRFYLIFAAFFLSGLNAAFLVDCWKVSSTVNQKYTDQDLLFVGSIASIANSLGRLIWGQLSDFISIRYTLSLLTATWCLTTALTPIMAAINIRCYTFIVAINFICLGGNFVLFIGATANAYGYESLGIIYGSIFFSQLLASQFYAKVKIILGLFLPETGIYFSFASALALSATLFILFGKDLQNPCSRDQMAEEDKPMLVREKP